MTAWTRIQSPVQCTLPTSMRASVQDSDVGPSMIDNVTGSACRQLAGMTLSSAAWERATRSPVPGSPGPVPARVGSDPAANSDDSAGGGGGGGGAVVVVVVGSG